jgi:hypothetical protein
MRCTTYQPGLPATRAALSSGPSSQPPHIPQPQSTTRHREPSTLVVTSTRFRCLTDARTAR